MYRVFSEDIEAEPFANPHESERAHVALVERMRDLQADVGNAELPIADAAPIIAQLRENVTAFEARLAATGSRLPDGSSRNLAQSILDFWALRQSDLAALAARAAPADKTAGRPESPAAKLLAPYDEATAIAAAARAEECYQSLPDDAARDRVRSGFLSLLQNEAPLSAEEVAALEPFAGAGVLSRLPGDAHGPPYGFGHEALPRAWPRLADWQLEATRLQSDLERIRSSAQAWKETHSVSELPHGASIDVVDRLAQRDPFLKDYAEAAKRRRRRERATLWGTLGILLALLILSGTLFSFKTDAEQEVQEVDSAETVAEEATVSSDRLQGPEADTAGGSSGWIWLGSSSLPQVALEDGATVDPAKLERGMKIRTRANLKVRRTMPADARNIAGERIGQVSSGVIVELRGDPVKVPVEGVDQYWAEVRVIPVVYIQLQENAEVPLTDLKEALRNSGYAVPEEQKLPRIARIAADLPFDVRYYYEQDAETAGRVASEVMGRLGITGAPSDRVLVSLADSPLAESVKTGTIEVWLYQR